MAASIKKSKKRNFTANEINVIISGVEGNINTLNSALTNCVTNTAKKEVWKSITQRVNANGLVKRTEDEVRRKWKDIRSSIKKKESDRITASKSTGGGSPPCDLTDAETRVLQMIPKVNTRGIKGGQETPMPQSYKVISASPSFDAEEVLAEPATTELATAEPYTFCMFEQQDNQDVPDATHSSSQAAQSSKCSRKRKLNDSRSVQESSSTELASSLIVIESQKLEVMQHILSIETERLEVEKSRLAVELRLLKLKEDRYSRVEVDPDMSTLYTVATAYED